MKAYYHTKESVQEYIKLAKDVSGKNIIENLKKYLPSGANLLELGSGPGTDWQILSETFHVTGSDLSLEFLKHLKKKHPEGTFIKLDAVSLDTPDKFDGIYSNKVLHHLKPNELKESISKQAQILKKNGVVCHTFWSGSGDKVFKGMYVKYHRENELKVLFRSNFNILKIRSYAEFEEDDSVLIIAEKK